MTPKPLIDAGAAALLLALSVATPAMAQSEKEHAEAIRDRFFAEVRRCGVEPRAETPIVIITSPIVEASYRYADRSVHLSRWDDLNPQMRGLIAAWAEQGTLGLEPEAMFRELFNDFIVPHELGHALSDDAGRMRGMLNWDSELEANRIAVAFWSLQPMPEGDIETRVANASRFYDLMPSPVPEGDDPRAFFELHYDDFLAGKDGPLNPATYGWFISRLLKQALAEREQYPFCDLVQLNAPVQADEDDA